jgi:hypothetical protein
MLIWGVSINCRSHKKILTTKINKDFEDANDKGHHILNT